MRVLVSPQIMNIPFLHNIFMKPSTWCGNNLKIYNSNEIEKSTKKVDYLLSQQYEQEMKFPYKRGGGLLLENEIPLPCMTKSKATSPNITSLAMMGVCDNIIDVEEG